MRSKLDYRSQGVNTLVLGRHAGEQAFDNPVGHIYGDQSKENPEGGLDHTVHGGALAGLDECNPVGIDVSEILLVLHAASQISQILLITGELLQ